jgi:hypothetical protein
MTAAHVAIARARRADCVELVQANQASRDQHLPWVEPFIDASGFDAWSPACRPVRMSAWWHAIPKTSVSSALSI